ncbi:MAG: histidine phosphatase family protein [Candidatus Doudnabacteria bacterium]|nr:histidine phosphatase family protein [Candidatus Doudnabacteria bacterium]
MMPMNLVLVRHGESEGNVARGRSEHGDNSLFTEEFMNRHSSKLRLTDKGRTQAIAAGEWIKNNLNFKFGRHMVSSYMRAMETAALLNLSNPQWYQDIYLRERDIGAFDIISEESKQRDYPKAFAEYKRDPFYWTPPNGESVAQLCLRIDRVLDTLHRECQDKNVIIVCHGMVMWGFMIRLEKLTPQNFLDRSQHGNLAFRIRNCQILHYTRLDPSEPSTAAVRCEWARSVCPWDLASPSLWRRISRPRYSNDELLREVELSPRLVS